jgi:hypothetical protein
MSNRLNPYEDGSSRFLWNDGKYLTNYTMSQPWWQLSSKSLLWEPQISYWLHCKHVPNKSCKYFMICTFYITVESHYAGDSDILQFRASPPSNDYVCYTSYKILMKWWYDYNNRLIVNTFIYCIWPMLRNMYWKNAVIISNRLPLHEYFCKEA